PPHDNPVRPVARGGLARAAGRRPGGAARRGCGGRRGARPGARRPPPRGPRPRACRRRPPAAAAPPHRLPPPLPAPRARRSTVGLGALTGGGAEVFADRVRRLVAPGKEHPDIWFHVHDTAHRLGIPTHCTLLYGHVETYEERVDHLLRLREQQDKTGGFLAFIPLAFHPANTVFERRGFKFQTGAADLKMLAVSRLLLDNIPNIKAYWIMMGLPLAQVALHFGANDVQGTLVREEIFRDGASCLLLRFRGGLIVEMRDFVSPAAAYAYAGLGDGGGIDS